jgi:hypothetical protein
VIESYLRRITGVLAIGAAFASIPLFASLSRLEPPWPPAIGYVSAALVLIGSLIAWEWTRAAALRHRRRWILVATILTLAALSVYLTLYSLFVETVPGTSARLIRGYACTSEAEQVQNMLGNQCPDLPREALEDAGWNPYELWTRSSITMVRLGLVLSWLIFTAGLVVVVGAIVAGREAGAGGLPEVGTDP